MSNSKNSSTSKIKDQPKLSFAGGQKPSVKPASKRFQPDTSNNSNTSNTSMDELALNSLHTQLEAMTDSLDSLRGDLKNMLKKDETEDLIKTTLTNIMASLELKMKDYVNVEVDKKTKTLEEKIEGLEFENSQLKDKLTKFETSTTQKINSLEEEVLKNQNMSREANRRSNYNEQYSRKNNVKIMDIPEVKDENELKLTETVKDKLKVHGVTLDTQDIVAIHRIPSKRGRIRPVLIKLKNNNIKASIMRKRRDMRNSGHRLVDDVTRLNQELINRLTMHRNIESAWYFNGSIYGLTDHDKRIRFDLYDNIDTVIRDFRERRRE